MQQIQTKVFPHQMAFIKSYAPSTGLVAGFGSGKSYAATLKCIERLKEFQVDIGYYLPTYSLIKAIAFKNFSYLLEKNQIPFTLHETDKIFYTPIGNIFLRSMDKPNNIVGYETGYALIDEADVLGKSKTEKAYKAIVARNRIILPEGISNSADMVSTPEGFQFLYDYYVRNKSDRRVLIKGKTLDNTFLPQSYIDNLYDTYTKVQLEAYMNGEFVNLTSGTVYHSFNRKTNHSDREIKPYDVLHIGMDFNITNMSASIRVSDGLITTAIGEVTGAYDTSEMISILKDRYPNNKKVIYPDASGSARNTAGDSDLKLLQKAGLMVRIRKQNPSVRDRITTVNASFLNSKGDSINFINTNNCPTLTESYEKLAYKNDRPDKESGYDHITDADGYCIFTLQKTSKRGRGRPARSKPMRE